MGRFLGMCVELLFFGGTPEIAPFGVSFWVVSICHQKNGTWTLKLLVNKGRSPRISNFRAITNLFKGIRWVHARS